jgi:hypothetical protein
MKCHSDKPMINYMHVRCAFKKNKMVHERCVWIVTVYKTPTDIVKYDWKTMNALRKMFFTPKAKNKHIIIREILEVVELSRSSVTLEGHKKMYENKIK